LYNQQLARDANYLPYSAKAHLELVLRIGSRYFKSFPERDSVICRAELEDRCKLQRYGRYGRAAWHWPPPAQNGLAPRNARSINARWT
jgi:hypothetical protein